MATGSTHTMPSYHALHMIMQYYMPTISAVLSDDGFQLNGGWAIAGGKRETSADNLEVNLWSKCHQPMGGEEVH